jgi:hypothetical protein
MVRAEGIEPSRPCGLRIFIPLRLSPPRQQRVRGLDYTFTIPHMRLRCCPSSLYTFPESASGLGSGLPFQVSPTLSSSTPSVSRWALKRLSPLRLPFRHARVEIDRSPIIKQAASAFHGIGPSTKKEAARVFPRARLSPLCQSFL